MSLSRRAPRYWQQPFSAPWSEFLRHTGHNNNKRQPHIQIIARDLQQFPPPGFCEECKFSWHLYSWGGLKKKALTQKKPKGIFSVAKAALGGEWQAFKASRARQFANIEKKIREGCGGIPSFPPYREYKKLWSTLVISENESDSDFQDSEKLTRLEAMFLVKVAEAAVSDSLQIVRDARFFLTDVVAAEAEYQTKLVVKDLKNSDQVKYWSSHVRTSLMQNDPGQMMAILCQYMGGGRTTIQEAPLGEEQAASRPLQPGEEAQPSPPSLMVPMAYPAPPGINPGTWGAMFRRRSIMNAGGPGVQGGFEGAFADCRPTFSDYDRDRLALWASMSHVFSQSLVRTPPSPH